jgi:hypothetical protein
MCDLLSTGTIGFGVAACDFLLALHAVWRLLKLLEPTPYDCNSYQRSCAGLLPQHIISPGSAPQLLGLDDARDIM